MNTKAMLAAAAAIAIGRVCFATPEVVANWIDEREGTIGTTGTWTGDVCPSAQSFEDGWSPVENAAFAAANASSGAQVTVTAVLTFGNDGDDAADGAQAAVKIGEVSGAPTFMVYTAGAWTAVAASGVTPDYDASYTVSIAIDYDAGTYGVTVDGAALAAGGATSFALATAGTAVETVELGGAGQFKSLYGEYVRAAPTWPASWNDNDPQGLDGKFETWAAENGVTAETVSAADEIAFLLGVAPVGNGAAPTLRAASIVVENGVAKVTATPGLAAVNGAVYVDRGATPTAIAPVATEVEPDESGVVTVTPADGAPAEFYKLRIGYPPRQSSGD